MHTEALDKLGITVDYSRGVKDTVNALHTKSKRIRVEMKALRTLLTNQELMDIATLKKYQYLNDQLRVCSIYKAEFIHTKNML